MEMSVDAAELVKLSSRMATMPRRVRRSIKKVNREARSMIEEALYRHASGRPGPNVITGEYRSSFYTELLESNEDEFVILAGNDSPQAARLEYGFFGVDSLGRNYAQPAFPHMRPALYEAQLWYRDAVLQAVREELRY